MKKIFWIVLALFICISLSSCGNSYGNMNTASSTSQITSTSTNDNTLASGTYDDTKQNASTASNADLSNTENNYIQNADSDKSAQTTGKYGEELYKRGDLLDALVYLSKANFLGYKSPVLNEVKKSAAKGIIVSKPIKLCNGWSPTISHNGRYVAYTWEEGNLIGQYIYDTKTAKSEKITRQNIDTVSSTPVWSNDDSMLASSNDNCIFVYNFKDNKGNTIKVDGKPDTNPIIWSNDNNKLAFIREVKNKFNVYVYDISKSELTLLCEGSQVIGFNSTSGQLLIQIKREVYSVAIKDKQMSLLGNLPQDVTTSDWSKDGKFGLGFAPEKDVGDESFGNYPIYFDMNSSKTIIAFPHSYTSDVRMNSNGNTIAFSERTSYIKDIYYSVLFAACIDGKSFAPIDNGYIETKPGFISDDGTILVYSKANDGANFDTPGNEVYLAKLSK